MALHWSEARAGDEDAILALMAAFYLEEGLVFRDEEAGVAVRVLLADGRAGRAFLLRDKFGKAHGHLVLTWGFSLEFGGRFVLLDELFVSAAQRGAGFGKQAIEFAARWAREEGATALRLEVNRANAHAREVYLRRGFEDGRRDMLTRWV